MLEELFFDLFKESGFDVQCEGITSKRYLDLVGKKPDLILDENIPVEVGGLNKGKEKIDYFFENGIEKMIWIPYPEIFDIALKVIVFEKKEKHVQENKKLRKENKKLKKRIKELKEKNNKKNKEIENYQHLKNEILKNMVDENISEPPSCPNCGENLKLVFDNNQHRNVWVCDNCRWDETRYNSKEVEI